MRKLLLSFILCLSNTVVIFSQSSLYMPLNFQEAYKNGTRSYDGNPGPEYWQNHADYNITASVDPASNILTGTENVIYYNDSPDTLTELVIRLYQNINRLGNVHDFHMDEKEPSEGMIITSLSLNGESIDLKDTTRTNETETNLVVKNLSILPGSTLKLRTEWNFKIPKINTIRMGAYDSTTFFIAYWYPQIAVYDDIDGWDKLDYTGTVEFYNDFNNFDVSITVPNNMCVWATGILKNPGEVMSPAVLERYNNAMGSDEIVNVISRNDNSSNTILFSNRNNSNTWHFNAVSVSDFTFGTSDHYAWDARSVNTGAGRVLVSSAYDPATKQFNGVCEVASQTVDYLSQKLPAVPFPFPKITVFQGEGGMESPMMVNEGSSVERIWMVYVTTHEVAHSYFPFYMGINERKYAWMDEGLTQFFSETIQWELDTTIDFRARDVFRYLNTSGRDIDLPMMVLSYATAHSSYGSSSYFRPAAAYNTLKELLGNELFKNTLQEFIYRWHGKHPEPYDFFFTFNDAANEDLDWFWNPWFFESGYPDLSIDTVILTGDKARVLVSNEGNIPVSVQLKFKFTDGKEKILFENCSVWRDDDEAWFEQSLDGKKLSSVILGSKHIPDADSTDNVWELR